MAATIDAVLRFGMIASLLLMSSAAGLCRAAAPPQRDAPRPRQEQQLAQQQDTAQRQSTETAAERSYQTCLSSAEAARDASRAAACKQLAEKTQQDRADCLTKLNLPQTYCDTSYPPRDGSPNCTLPDQIATVFNASLQQARYRCLREREAAQP